MHINDLMPENLIDTSLQFLFASGIIDRKKRKRIFYSLVILRKFPTAFWCFQQLSSDGFPLGIH